ncbi:MAG TPA: iron ABC transporter permease [Baekduia sp.]|uniref:ABC transporter permease n=1 Tax=Baekduia sp. TaxID=2600305 RepID=UPI002B8E3F92|nr:iron ABC transporter permease [Baekduia sp.]HMJ33385.1 iron ABC transporter permease [Baekduia sp.]
MSAGPISSVGAQRSVLPAPRGARWRGTGLQGAVWLVTAGLIILPLLPLVYASVRSRPLYEAGGTLTLQGYRDLLSDPAFWRAARNTLEFAVTVTTISVVWGAALAVLIERTDLPARRLLGHLALLPILLPPLGLIMGWTTLYGDGGYLTGTITGTLHLPWDLGTPWGMGVMGGAVAMPVALITLRSALRGGDASLEDAARSAGASAPLILRRITIPMLRPALANAALLIFTISLEQLGIPIFLGAEHDINFFASYLYDTWSNSETPDPASVSAGAVLLLLTATVLIMLRQRLVGAGTRFIAEARVSASQPLPLGRWRLPAAAVATALLLVTVIGPVGGVILASFVTLLTPLLSPFSMLTLDNFHTAVSDPALKTSIRNSVVLGAAGAVTTTGLIAVATLVAHRSQFALRHSLRFLMLYPRSIPGIIVSLAFFWSYLFFVPPGDWLRNNLVGEGVALVVRGIPLAYMIMAPSLARIAEELDGAGRVVGASWWTTSRRIVLPLLRPAIFGSLTILFVAMLNDYEAAIFLAKPGTELMGVEMVRQYMQGTEGPVAAMAVIQLGITAIVLGIGALLIRLNRGAPRA